MSNKLESIISRTMWGTEFWGGRGDATGVIIFGGTIVCNVDEQGRRVPGRIADANEFFRRNFPESQLKYSEPGTVGLNLFSEDHDYETQGDILMKLIYNHLMRQEVRNIIVPIGSDTLIDNGKYLAKNLDDTLQDEKVRIFLVSCSDGFPHPTAKNTLNRILGCAASPSSNEKNRRYSQPKVYVALDDKICAAGDARDSIYAPNLGNGKIFDIKNSTDVAQEQLKRKQIDKIAERIAQKLGYRGGTKELQSKSGMIVVNSLKVEDKSAPFDKKVFVWFVDKTGGYYREAHDIINKQINPLDIPETLVLVLHHSGTCYTHDKSASPAFAARTLREKYKTLNFGVTTTGEPFGYQAESYITSQRLLEAGVFPVPMHRKVLEIFLAHALLKGIKENYLVNLIYTQIDEEQFTGDIDWVSVKKIKEMYGWRDLRL